MSTGTKQFRHSQLSELGQILRKGELNYHYRSVAMADGSAGLFYGDEGDGPEDPVLLILDYLQLNAETVQYYVRPNAKGDGNIMWINIDKKDAATRLARYKAQAATPTVTPPPPAKEETPGVIAPPSQKVDPPPAQKVEPPVQKTEPGVIAPPSAQDKKETPVDPPPVQKTQPPKQEVPFPTQPPPVQSKSGGKTPLDDPYYGYGSRNAMLDAKDGYFRWLEGYKLHHDEIMDREFSFRYFFDKALDLVKETGKNLQPSDLRKTAWTLAIEMFNEYRTFKYNEHGQIVNDGSAEGGQPA